MSLKEIEPTITLSKFWLDDLRQHYAHRAAEVYESFWFIHAKKSGTKKEISDALRLCKALVIDLGPSFFYNSILHLGWDEIGEISELHHRDSVITVGDISAKQGAYVKQSKKEAKENKKAVKQEEDGNKNGK